ncbi:MAG: hypothetical protein AAF658_14770 [Myxococcota bacterium]
MTVRWTYIVLLSLAFSVGLVGTVLAAKALGTDDEDRARPALHQPKSASSLPTVEC